MALLRVAIFLVLSFLTVSCTPAVNEPSNLTPNITLPEANITDDGNLSISKEALDKEFLLQASFINQEGNVYGSPTSWGTQSRIVFFTKNNGSLFMMESTKGFLASEELPASRILAEFKIVEEKEDKLVFDFNEGMKKIFLVGDWFGSDFGDYPNYQWAVKVDHSFLKEVTKQTERILIRQITQVHYWDVVFPIEVVYYLRPYNPDPSFQATLTPGFEKMGFFEANPQVRPELGGFKNYITKWNLAKPVVYHISHNTPKEYVDAVKEGVLYWNKALGGEVLQVKMAPEGITAPNPDYNIIQWVTNHSAGLAYADAQMDPRTGEILHAQIYLMSGWAVQPLDELLAQAAVEDNKDSKAAKEKFPLQLKGFSSGSLCQYPQFKNLLELVSLENGDKKIPLKLSQDLIRLIAAHEVGHTLGLRHNFAGSVGSEMTPAEIGKIFKDYLKTGEVHNLERSSSSVMDYLSLEADILAGAYIAQEDSKPLAYDEMALRWSYFNETTKKSLSEVLFCTDSDLGWWSAMYEDCKPGDRNPSSLNAAFDFEQAVLDLPRLVAWHYLTTKTYFDPKWRKPVEEVGLDAGVYTAYTTYPLTDFLRSLKSDTHFLLIEKSFPNITDVNEKDVQEAANKWLDKIIRSAGGVQKLLSLIDTHKVYEEAKKYQTEFEAIVDRLSFREGTTALGESYTFSNAEIAKMKKAAKPFFELLQEKLIRRITEVLAQGGGGYWPATPVAESVGPISLYPKKDSTIYRSLESLDGLEETLGNWAEFIITDEAEKKPTFDGDHRLLATDILRPNQGSNEDWQKANRERVLQILLAKLKQRFGAPIDQIDPEQLSKEERKAFELELSIVQALQLETEKPIPPQS